MIYKLIITPYFIQNKAQDSDGIDWHTQHTSYVTCGTSVEQICIGEDEYGSLQFTTKLFYIFIVDGS